jgi:hypothetical protein
MKIFEWYDIIQKQDTVIVAYKSSTRIKAIIGLAFIVILTLFYYFNVGMESITIGLIIIGLVFLLLLFTSLIADSFTIYPEQNFLKRQYGVYPFVATKEITPQEIDEIRIEEVTKKRIRDYLMNKKYTPKFFSLTIFYKDGERDNLGEHPNEKKFLAEKIKRIMNS